MTKLNKIALFCIFMVFLVVVVGCAEKPVEKKLVVTHKPAFQKELPEVKEIISDVEVTAEADELENITEQTIEIEIIEVNETDVLSEEDSHQVFNESDYLKINLSDISENENLRWEYFLDESKIIDLLEGRIYINRSLVNVSITFITVVRPRVLQGVEPNHTNEMLELVEGNNSVYLTQNSISNEFSLFCELTNFVVTYCDNFEMFGKYAFYGVLRENISGRPTDSAVKTSWFYNQKLDIHKVVQLEPPPLKFQISDGYACDSDSNCDWVAANCCPEHSGAEWYCLNKQTEEYLCREISVVGCNEYYSQKPTENCGCRENRCVTG